MYKQNKKRGRPRMKRMRGKGSKSGDGVSRLRKRTKDIRSGTRTDTSNARSTLATVDFDNF